MQADVRDYLDMVKAQTRIERQMNRDYLFDRINGVAGERAAIPEKDLVIPKRQRRLRLFVWE